LLGFIAVIFKRWERGGEANHYTRDMHPPRLDTTKQIHQNIDMDTATPRYHEVPRNIKPKAVPPVTTAYMDAAVIAQAPWIPNRKRCKRTCCVENIAISLDQDDTHIKNTFDGRELADLIITNPKILPPSLNVNGGVEFFATDFSLDFIPCLQPGTIIFLDNSKDILQQWFDEYRSMIRIPHLLITSDTDSTSPDPLYKDRLSKKKQD